MPQLQTKKISELAEAQSYNGLRILATDSNNTSKRFAFGSYADNVQKLLDKLATTDEELAKAVELLAQKEPEKKEIITVVTCADTFPDITQLSEGDKFIFTGDMCLYEIDEYQDERIIEADANALYKTADTLELYLWDGTQFIKVSNEETIIVDDTIYIGAEFQAAIVGCTPQVEYGAHPVVVMKHTESDVVLTHHTGASKLLFAKWVRDKLKLGLAEAKRLVDNINTTPINLSDYNYSLTDDDKQLFVLIGVTYTGGVFDTLTATYTLVKISDTELYLSNRNGWSDLAFLPNSVPPIGKTLKDIWNWHEYEYKGHTHTSDEIEDFNEAVAALLPDKNNSEKDVIEVENEAVLYDIEDPQSETIYITADENKLFIWDGERFIDVTNSASGNTIYVRTLSELLNMTLTQSGIYTVCVILTSLAGGRTTNYTLVVNTTTSRARKTSTQSLFLSSKDGWADVIIDEDGNKSWNWHYYAYQSDEGEVLEYATESDVEMYEPLPSDMVTEIVNGEFDPSDIVQFTGTSQYRAMTQAEVKAIVQSAFAD